MDWFSIYLKFWREAEFFADIELESSPGVKSYAWLSKANRKNRLGLPYRAIGYNASLSNENESMTLEYNGFAPGLVAESNPSNEDHLANPQVCDLLLTELRKVARDGLEWDEIVFNALNENQFKAIEAAAKNLNLICYTAAQSLTYSVDLEQIRKNFGDDFFKFLSANSRQQFRKAMRDCERDLGELNFSTTQTSEESLHLLKELATHHNLRWNPDGLIMGFGNPRFVEFYKSLTDSLTIRKELRIQKLMAGQTLLAIMFNVTYFGKVYFAIGAVNYEGTSKYKPGILGHLKSIEFALKAGDSTYDFMAGTTQYKQSLSSTQSLMQSLIVRRKRLDFVIEDRLRRIKRGFKGKEPTKV